MTAFSLSAPRRGLCALAALPVAALLLTAAPAHAGGSPKTVTINFNNFTKQATADGGFYNVGTTYTTQGFTFGTNNELQAFAGSGNLGDGETSLGSGYPSVTLTLAHGQAFSLNAIDLGPFAGNLEGTFNDGPETFTGIKADGTTVTDTVTTNNPNGHFQTFTFTNLTDLKSLSFGSTYSNGGYGVSQFDNLVLTTPAPVPEASSVVSLGLLLLGLGGVAVAKRRKAAAS